MGATSHGDVSDIRYDIALIYPIYLDAAGKLLITGEDWGWTTIYRASRQYLGIAIIISWILNEIYIGRYLTYTYDNSQQAFVRII